MCVTDISYMCGWFDWKIIYKKKKLIFYWNMFIYYRIVYWDFIDCEKWITFYLNNFTTLLIIICLLHLIGFDSSHITQCERQIHKLTPTVIYKKKMKTILFKLIKIQLNEKIKKKKTKKHIILSIVM